MRRELGLLSAVGRQAAAVPDRAAHALLLGDVNRWLRLQFLGVASRVGIADALAEPATLETVADRAHVTDLDVLDAFLQLGVALGELRCRGDRYEIKGRRLHAVAGRSTDLRGLVEEVVAYGGPLYTGLGEHLRGAPARDYLDGVGDAIAQASRLIEPLLAPAIRALAASAASRRVLDVGCGSGVYLEHVLDAVAGATAVGIDLDQQAISTARATLATQIASGRCEVRTASLDDVVATSGDETFDLVLLLNNLYYWPPDDRPDVLSRMRALAPHGTVAVATAIPNRQAFNRHLDLELRVTKGSWRLPTTEELGAALRAAGFTTVELIEPVPRVGFVVAVGS